MTPNAVMFDPNVSDPLVVKNGVDMFGVVTKMEYIVAAAIYRDIHAIECLQHLGYVCTIHSCSTSSRHISQLYGSHPRITAHGALLM